MRLFSNSRVYERVGAPSLEIEEHGRVAPAAFFHLVTLRKPGARDTGQIPPSLPPGSSG